MKIKVTSNELLKKMDRALGVIAAKAMTPVLAYVKIEVISANRANIYGTDLGSSIIQGVEIALESADQGSILIPARQVSDLLKALPNNSEITIEQDGESTRLKCTGRKANVKLPGMPSTGFPVIEVPPAAQFNINTAALKKVTSLVDFAAPSKGGRTSVPSVLLESDGEKLQAAATDGFRVAVAFAKGINAGVFSIQLPKLLLPLLQGLPGDNVGFSQTETNFFFSAGNELIIVRKPMTTFPPYQRAYTTKYKTAFNVAVPTFLDALSWATAVVDKANPALNIEVEASNMRLIASSVLGGESDQDVEVTPKPLNEPNKVRMNTTYIRDYLSQIEGQVTVELSNERSLAKFSNGDESFVCFIMPMQDPKPATTPEAPAAKA